MAPYSEQLQACQASQASIESVSESESSEHACPDELGQKVDERHQARVAAYRAMGTPWCLADMLAREDPHLALRIFLLDNSGSTRHSDGHMLQRDHRGRLQAVPATRWAEISSMALAHAEWNARAGVRSEFLLLNSPCPDDPVDGRDFVVVDPKAGDPLAQVAVLDRVLRENGPRGLTPLASRLQQLHKRLCAEVTDGRRVMLTIVTDGLPTSVESGKSTEQERGRLVQELRAFASASNCFVAIRLATDEDTAIEYYNRIDEEMELPLDILDDLKGEAEEIHACGNAWLTYTPLLHRIREGGTTERLFDLLDERALEPPEIAKFLELLFRGPEDAAFPRDAWDLYRTAQEAVARAPLVYDGHRGCVAPPVDLACLKQTLGVTSSRHSTYLKSLPLRVFRAMTCAKHLPRG